MQRWRMVLVVLMVAGCRRSEGPSKPPRQTSEPVVATFADRRITTSELQRYFDDQSSFVRFHYGNAEGKKAVLQIMIQTELLADQAVKEGFDVDDEAVEQYRKAIITQWMRAKFHDDEGESDLSAADLRAYYEAHRAEYQRPERVRVRMTFFKASPGREAAVQAEAEKAARSLSQAKDRTAPADLAARDPEDASRGRQLDLDFRSHDELAKSYGEAVAAAADALKAPQELSPVVRGTGGFYLLQFEGRTPAEGRSFEASEPELRSRLWDEQRNKRYDDFLKTLVEQAEIKIDDAELAKVNLGSSDKAPQPASAVQPTSLEEQLRTTLPPYRESPADRVGPVVATFAGHQIPTAELERYFDEQSPYVRSQLRSEKAKKQLLNGLITGQLLVDEGLKKGFQHDQIALDRFKKSMITGWMEGKFNEAQGERSFSEAEVRAYYQAHRDDYHRPERLRVEMIFFKATPAHEAAVQAEAEEALRSLSQAKDRGAFSRLAETRSDDVASRKTLGDLDFRSHDELAKSYGAAVAAAAESLVAPGELSRVVRGDGGFYLLRFEERLPALNLDFEASEKQIRSQLWTERRAKLFNEYLYGLMKQAQIKIDETELAKLEVDAGVSSGDASQLAPSALQFGWEKQLASEKRLRTPLTPLPDFPYTAQQHLGSP